MQGITQTSEQGTAGVSNWGYYGWYYPFVSWVRYVIFW
jgi:hypothetical protein